MSEDKTYTEAQVQELIQTRTAELRESRNALTAEVAQLRPAVADWEKKAAGLEAEVGVLSAVQSQLDDLRAKHAASEARWGQDRVLLGAGIDDEDAAGVLRSRYVAAEEPGDFAAWFEREGRQIPLIASFISTPTNGAGEPPAAAPTEAAPPNMPSSNNGRKPNPPAAQPYTPGSISGMSREEFRAHRDELMEGVKIPFG